MKRLPKTPFSYNECEIFLRVMKATNGHGREAFIIDDVDFRWVPRVDQLIPREIVDEVLYRRSAGDVASFLEYPIGSDKSCQYCGGTLTSDHDEDEYEAQYVKAFYHESKDGFDQFYRDLKRCPTCGWWWVEMMRGRVVADEIVYEHFETYHVMGVLRTFEVSAPQAGLEDLVAWLRRNEKSISDIDPFRFEDLMASCLKERMGDLEIKKVGGRKDRGIDIIQINSSGEPIFIQVKRRADLSSTETVATIRALNGVLLRRGKPHGMLITTAKQFSPATYAEIEETRRNNPTGTFSRYHVDLMAGADVIKMLHKSRQDEKVFYPHVSIPTFAEWLARYDPDAASRDVR